MIRKVLAASAFIVMTAIPVLAIDFDHDAHLTYLEVENKVCTTCHLEDANDIQPNSKVCLECHDQEFYDQVVFPGLTTHEATWASGHKTLARIENTQGRQFDCSNCHQQSFCLDCHKAGFADEMGEFSNNMTNVHRSDFTVTHPIASRTNPQLCRSCHEVKFCSDCHDSFAPADLAILSHRRGFTDATLGGAHAGFNVNQCQGCHVNSVLPTHDWSNSHAREARKNLTTCQACHPEGDVCMKCHSAVSGLKVNPHPREWNDMKDRVSDASDGRTCRKCH